jgi:PAS domain S-box-containing protein
LSGGSVQAFELERLLEALNNPVLAWGLDGRIVFANAAVERLSGWSARELVGLPIATLVLAPRGWVATDRPARASMVGRAGGEIVVEVVVSEVRQPGSSVLLVGVLHAIEATLVNYEELLDNAPAAIAIVQGEEMRYVLSNALNQQLVGGRQLVGKTIREALPELEADGVVAIVERVYQTGEPYLAHQYPVTVVETADAPARRAFVNGVAQPLRGANGAVEGVMIFAYEVTDLVTSRERLREAEERLRLAIESARLGTWDYDVSARTIRCDARYRELSGLGPDADIVPEELAAGIHPDDRAAVMAAANRSFDPASGGEFAAEFRATGVEDGVERWVAVRGRMFFDDKQRPSRFVGIGADVTPERRALERQRFLADASTILASSLDPREMLPRIAALAVPLLGDWCTIHFGDGDVAAAHVDPTKLDLVRELGARERKDQTSALGVGRVLASGRPELVPQLTAAGLRAAARDPAHLEILERLHPRSAMFLPLRGRDGTIGVLSLFGAESGRTYGEADLAFAGELADRAAAAIDNARLYEQATKAIGVRDQFLSIASHELRTPLTSLTLQLSSVSRLARNGTLATLPADKLEERVGRMERQTARLTSLVNELLDVSRISTGRLAINCFPTDLVEVVSDVVERLSDEAGRARAPLIVRAPEELTGTWDANRLDQVLTNLVGNAIKYAPGKPIDIDVARIGERAVVSVRDRGPGITEQDQQRIFERFERAAPPAMAGLGLGLWISSRIAQAHGGSIRVDSRPGHGATFVVELPLAAPCREGPEA